jgi:hypothetical protein
VSARGGHRLRAAVAWLGAARRLLVLAHAGDVTSR